MGNATKEKRVQPRPKNPELWVDVSLCLHGAGARTGRDDACALRAGVWREVGSFMSTAERWQRWAGWLPSGFGSHQSALYLGRWSSGRSWSQPSLAGHRLWRAGCHGSCAEGSDTEGQSCYWASRRTAQQKPKFTLSRVCNPALMALAFQVTIETTATQFWFQVLLYRLLFNEISCFRG